MNKKFAALTVFSALSLGAAVISQVPIENNFLKLIASDNLVWNHYEQVDPTFTEAGHRNYYVCCGGSHEVVFEKPTSGTVVEKGKLNVGVEETNLAYLPILNSSNYNKTFTFTNNVLTETFSTKDGNEQLDFQIASGNRGGFIGVYGSDDVLNWYFPGEFNQAFAETGIVMSFDNNQTTTLTIPTGGVVLEDVNFVFNTNYGSTLKITGGPLTINTTNENRDGFNVSCRQTSSTHQATLIIDNETKILYTGSTTMNKSGLSVKQLQINQNKKLSIAGFGYGIWFNATSGKTNTINGSLSVQGTSNAAGGGGGAIQPKSDFIVKVDHEAIDKATTYATSLVVSNGKHLTIGGSDENVFDTKYVISQTPTSSKPGKLNKICADCMSVIENNCVTIPALSSDFYELNTTIGKSDNGEVCELSTFKLLDKSYGDISGSTGAVPLTSYIKIGDTYMTPSIWNSTFTNSRASESEVNGEKVLTITVNNGLTQNIIYSDYLPDTVVTKNGVDFSTYSKVVFAGNGTINFNYNKSNLNAGLSVTQMVIESGTSVNVKGTKTSSAKDDYYGLLVKGDTTIYGKLNLSYFSCGINIPSGITDGVDINIDGEVIISNVFYGIHNYSPIVFTNNGRLNITAGGAGSSYYGISCNNAATYKFIGSSVTNIQNTGYGFYGNIGKLCVYIQDDADFTLNSGYRPMYYLNSLVVGNGENGLEQCTAKVSISSTAGGQPIIYFRPVAKEQSLSVFNSSDTINITGNKTTNAITYYGGNNGTSFKSQFLSVVQFSSVKSLFTFTSCNGKFVTTDSFVTKDGSGNPTIKVGDSIFEKDYTNAVDSLPANIPSSIQKLA